jgi:hypothetical protein
MPSHIFMPCNMCPLLAAGRKIRKTDGRKRITDE